MSAWTGDELATIDERDELEIAGLRPDGTLHRFTTIWVVRVAGDVYVRSVNGRGAAWFRGAQNRHQGRISIGDIDKDVEFVEIDDEAIATAIDDVYRTKYRRYATSIIDSITSAGASAATLRLVPCA